MIVFLVGLPIGLASSPKAFGDGDVSWHVATGQWTLLLRSLGTGRPPPLWSARLLVAWTNMPASFPLAIVIAGAIAVDALRTAGWKTWPQWAAFLSVSVVAVMLNANGFRGILQPFHI